jgi:hypothetical protein
MYLLLSFLQTYVNESSSPAIMMNMFEFGVRISLLSTDALHSCLGKIVRCTVLRGNGATWIEKPLTASVSGFSFLCSHSGLNQGPPDYESGALTN